jgi:2-polyprenyl-6-methoxyphenol hydroxylase-like FAD-dependent oxidoreductase
LRPKGQGAGVGIEDGAALAERLSRAQSTEDDIPKLLKAFQDIRKPRTERVSGLSRMIKEDNMVPDGDRHVKEMRSGSKNRRIWKMLELGEAKKKI